MCAKPAASQGLNAGSAVDEREHAGWRKSVVYSKLTAFNNLLRAPNRHMLA
jgi:hypothetical protein